MGRSVRIKNKSQLIKGVNEEANVIIHKLLSCEEKNELITQKGHLRMSHLVRG